jgi:succinylarginine dihydrolase
MDALDGKIDSTAAALNAKIDSTAAALHARMDALDGKIDSTAAALNAKINSTADDLRTEMVSMRRELIEHTENVETRLLTEFWKWARTADARYMQATGAVTFVEQRLTLIEDRVSELERRKAS